MRLILSDVERNDMPNKNNLLADVGSDRNRNIQIIDDPNKLGVELIIFLNEGRIECA
jgi:hypothetical protein